MSSTQPAPAPQATHQGGGVPSELLTFSLGGERFGINVMRVQEILDSVSFTRVPNAEPFAPGVINVRGNVVPVVDFRQRFALPAATAVTSDTARTVVFEIELAGEPTRVAIVVDAVHSVETVQELEVEDIPVIGTRWNRSFVHGITRIREQLTIILNLTAVFDLSIDAAGEAP